MNWQQQKFLRNDEQQHFLLLTPIFYTRYGIVLLPTLIQRETDNWITSCFESGGIQQKISSVYVLFKIDETNRKTKKEKRRSV